MQGKVLTLPAMLNIASAKPKKPFGLPYGNVIFRMTGRVKTLPYRMI